MRLDPSADRPAAAGAVLGEAELLVGGKVVDSTDVTAAEAVGPLPPQSGTEGAGAAIEDALRFHKANPLSRQLEIETYTWDVLPDSLKTGNIIDYICQEIEWVRGQLS